LLAWLCAAAPVSPATAEASVVVTIKPVHALVLQVMQGVGAPVLLVKGASSPHGYALTPGDALALSHAAVLFRVSAATEPFTQRLIGALPSDVEVVTLMAAPGLRLFPARRGPIFAGLDAGREAEAHARVDHADGHVWLDPDNAQLMVEQIARVLIRHDPAHRTSYSTNADALKGRLHGLASELEGTLRPIVARPYFVFHDAMQYFEHRFGLNAIGTISVSPDMPPSGKRLLQVRQRLTAGGAVCVFAEPQSSAALIGTLVEGSDARVGTLDPEATMLPPGPDLYFALMRGLAAQLTHCLALPS
jgi:zinc transport system substrate-binding protein